MVDCEGLRSVFELTLRPEDGVLERFMGGGSYRACNKLAT